MTTTTATATDRHGTTLTVKVGDFVCFKCDIEQAGQIVAISRDSYGHVMLVLENPNGFSGEYIGGETRTEERLTDCWID